MAYKKSDSNFKMIVSNRNRYKFHVVRYIVLKLWGQHIYNEILLGIHEYATTVMITIKPVQLEARKVIHIIRDIMVQPGFNDAHNIWLMCFNQQAQLIIKLGDKAMSIKVHYWMCTSIYMMAVIQIRIRMRVRRAKGIRLRRVCRT